MINRSDIMHKTGRVKETLRLAEEMNNQYYIETIEDGKEEIESSLKLTLYTLNIMEFLIEIEKIKGSWQYG